MKVVMDESCPHRFWVTSESEQDKSYQVELGKFPVGLNEQGVMVFNGACICTKTPDAWYEYGCEDFRFRCEPKLKDPRNMGKRFQCKHIKSSREFALDFIVPHLVAADKNMPDDHQI